MQSPEGEIQTALLKASPTKHQTNEQRNPFIRTFIKETDSLFSYTSNSIRKLSCNNYYHPDNH